MKNSKLIRITITGVMGRMGQLIANLAARDSRFQIVAGVEHPSSEAIGRFMANDKAPIVSNVSEVLPKTDVVVDFSNPAATVRLVQNAVKHRVAVVIGTTGLSMSQIRSLRAAARRIPLVFSPNMSVGVNVLFKLIRQAAQVLASYDIEITEAHHNQKKDSPSGTALKLAEIAAQASGRSPRNFVYGRHGQVGARSNKEIGILSLRAGDIVGDHTVLFSNAGERLELTHRAHSREAFAVGALSAAAWISGRRPGFYSMMDVLALK